jgi:large subunit ribosomal protein LP0
MLMASEPQLLFISYDQIQRTDVCPFFLQAKAYLADPSAFAAAAPVAAAASSDAPAAAAAEAPKEEEAEESDDDMGFGLFD